LKNGKRGNCKKCPAALAILETWPEAISCEVDYNSVWVISDGLLWKAYTSPALHNFITKYDGDVRTYNVLTFNLNFNTIHSYDNER
jgi:hypothetical protein